MEKDIRRRPVKEKSWWSIDYPCVVINSPYHGHRCGYVGIPERHALYGVNYNDETHKLAGFIDAVVKPVYYKYEPEWALRNIGPIPTFMMVLDTTRMKPMYCIGVHGGVTYSKVSNDYPMSIQNYWWFGYDCGHDGDWNNFSRSGQHRSLEYCFYECIRLADQLRRIDIEYKRRKNILFRRF